MELLKFIFSSFWVFIGFSMLLAILSSWSPIVIKRGLNLDEIKKIIKSLKK